MSVSTYSEPPDESGRRALSKSYSWAVKRKLSRGTSDRPADAHVWKGARDETVLKSADNETGTGRPIWPLRSGNVGK